MSSFNNLHVDFELCELEALRGCQVTAKAEHLLTAGYFTGEVIGWIAAPDGRLKATVKFDDDTICHEPKRPFDDMFDVAGGARLQVYAA